MAGMVIVYYRNYDSSDTTATGSRYTSSDPLPTIEACGWEPPSGYQFKEWNTNRDGTGLSFQPGDTISGGSPGYDLSKYAMWESIPVPYLVMDSDLTAVANAIRTKGGTSAELEWPDEFVDAIDAISGGGSLHSVNGLANPSPTVFNYDTMSWTYNSMQFAEGTPVIAAVESASRNLTVRRSDTSAEVTSVQISANTSTGIQKVFIMPDCDVTISTGVTPIK